MSVADGPAEQCPRCGAPLRPDQDWCLNCGTAVTTEVAGARGWRTPVAIVGVVLVLAAGALAFAFLEISDDADRTAQAPPSTPTPAQTPATPTPQGPTGPTGPTAPTGPTGVLTPTPTPTLTPTPPDGNGTPTPRPPLPNVTPTPGTSATPTPPTSGQIAEWPEGEDAWTVILFSGGSRPEAEKKAKGFQAQGKSVGILHSDDYSSLRPGYWVVFSGQYDEREQAQTAAEGFGSTAPGAYARRVTPK